MRAVSLPGIVPPATMDTHFDHPVMTRLAGMFLMLLLVVPGFVEASGRKQLTVHQCIDLVAAQYETDPLPIRLLLDVEGGWEGAVRQNTNGTEDLGPLQINSIHLPEFAALGITREEIRDNTGCRNVFVGVTLYMRHLRATGNPAQAIARYHSKTPQHAAKYLTHVANAIERRQRKLLRDQAIATK